MLTEPEPAPAPGQFTPGPTAAVTPLPRLGFLHDTAAVAAWSRSGPLSRLIFLQESLRRHLLGDDGDIDQEDKHMNEAARKADTCRVLSAYTIPPHMPGGIEGAPDPKVWIITNLAGADTDTCILFPSDY